MSTLIKHVLDDIRVEYKDEFDRNFTLYELYKSFVSDSAIFFLNRKEARCIASSMVSVIFISSFRLLPYHGHS